MKQWKDTGPKIKHYRLMLFGSVLSLGLGLFSLLEGITIPHVLSICLSVFLLWAIKWNGYYKIARRITEMYLKRKDNKWRK